MDRPPVKRRTLPLGIDIGRTRLRIAEVSVQDSVASIDVAASIDIETRETGEVGRLLAGRIAELGIRERRCILSIGEPDATLRSVAFPPMSARERTRAAAFEARRYVDDIERRTVQIAPIDVSRGLFTLGIADTAALDARLAVVKAAKLRAVAVDHEACALRRAFPLADAVLDVGAQSSRLYAFGPDAPVGLSIDGGSNAFTGAISRSLGIDGGAAERRKRATGFAGAGEAELAAFAHAVGHGLLSARSQGVTDIQRLVLTGNGARLPGLAARLERDTGCSVDLAAHVAIAKSAYAEDVLRAGAPDWALAVSLAAWSLREAAA